MRSHADFPEHADENRRIWNANACWWDDRIGEGNDFQTLLIEPATERLLNVTSGDTILDVACGAGRFTRRMASLGATIVAIDTSSEFIARARGDTTARSEMGEHAGRPANSGCPDATRPRVTVTVVSC